MSLSIEEVTLSNLDKVMSDIAFWFDPSMQCAPNLTNPYPPKGYVKSIINDNNPWPYAGFDSDLNMYVGLALISPNINNNLIQQVINVKEDITENIKNEITKSNKEVIQSNKEKLSHLEKHEYDPNCKFCMNNIFVKDAIATKEKVGEQETELTQLTISHNDLGIELSKYKNVEILWDELVELKGKYQKWIVLKEKAESELSRLETRIELLETQLDKVEEDIEKYYEEEAALLEKETLEKELKSK